MKQLIWLMLLFLPLGSLAEEVFRALDENGQVIFSDRPTGSSQEEVIEVRTGARRSVATQSAQNAEPAAANSPTAGESLTAEMPRESTPEELAEDRARNCEVARQKNETYSTAHRLYRQTADGEREYLTSEELDQARATAEADVANWCG